MRSEAQTDGKLGYEEYALLPEDGKRHEIIDGRHFVNPAPNTYHQTLSRRIQFQLYTQLEVAGRGQVFDAPTDLQLAPNDIVQPDLIVVLSHNVRIIKHSRIQGIPDLVVEILSGSSLQTDRGAKKALYETAGVAEYWIVDPDTQHLDRFVLDGRAYTLLGHHKTRVTSNFVGGVTVDLARVW